MKIKRKSDGKILTVDKDINAASAVKMLMRGEAEQLNEDRKKKPANGG